jgi:hypothetical protein
MNRFGRSRFVTILLSILGISAVGVLALYLTFRTRRLPESVERVGEIEIVTHPISYVAGFNEGRLTRGVTENYSLRYHGKRISFPGLSGTYGQDTVTYERFNSIITFPTTEPTVLVNVGDPNNSSFYYLIREKNGALAFEHIADGRGGVSADWLDPSEDIAERSVAVHRRHLEGGRYLLLDQFAVLDTKTLLSHRFEYNPHGSVNQFKAPITMSPDKRSFVRMGSGDFPDNLPVFIVFDFLAASSYVLPIERSLMRYNDWVEVDRAWLDRHFEWTKNLDGHDVLVRRASFAPLPYRGYRPASPHDSTYREYKLMRVVPEMKDSLIAFIEREFKAARAPQEGYSSSVELRIGDKVVHILLHDDEVGLWMERGQDSSLVYEIGDRFDAMLATGKHDDMFLP